MPDEFVKGSSRFGPEIEAAVDRLLAEVGASTWAGGQRCTLDLLLRRRLDLAEHVEDGYSSTGPELTNDVWCRQVLAAIWSRLPVQVQDANSLELGRADARFIAATIPWPGHEGEIEWWQWRIPRSLCALADGGFEESGWPLGWGMMPFPKPAEVEVTFWG